MASDLLLWTACPKSRCWGPGAAPGGPPMSPSRLLGVIAGWPAPGGRHPDLGAPSTAGAPPMTPAPRRRDPGSPGSAGANSRRQCAGMDSARPRAGLNEVLGEA